MHLAPRLRDVLVRTATALGLALLVLPTVNCYDVVYSQFGAKVQDKPLKLKAKSKAPKYHYVAVTAVKEGADATLVTRQDLWGPFRITTLAALYDEKHADIGAGSFGMQLLGTGTESFTLTCTRSGTGIDVTATKDPGGVVLGTANFPNATRVELSISTTGTKAVLESRRVTSQPYTLLGEFDTTSVGPFQPQLFTEDMKKKSVIGFNNARVTGRQPRPGDRTPAQAALDTVYAAGDLLTEAYHDANGGTDVDAAKVHSEAALLLIDAATTAITALPESEDRASCLSLLGKGAASARKLVALVDANASASKLYKPARSAVEAALAASVALRRID